MRRAGDTNKDAKEMVQPMDSLVNSRDGEALLRYLDADYDIIRPGRFVICAVTGARIPLEGLRYWNVDTQEAYVDAAAAMIGFGVAKTPGGRI